MWKNANRLLGPVELKRAADHLSRQPDANRLVRFKPHGLDVVAAPMPPIVEVSAEGVERLRAFDRASAAKLG